MKYRSLILFIFFQYQEHNSHIGYFLKIAVKYSEQLHDLYNFCQNSENQKCERLVCSLYEEKKMSLDEKEYVVHITTLKQ